LIVLNDLIHHMITTSEMKPKQFGYVFQKYECILWRSSPALLNLAAALKPLLKPHSQDNVVFRQ